jgi:hypothetical protein
VAEANNVILYLAATSEGGRQATIEVDETLDQAQGKLMPGIWIDFTRGAERILVNAALVTHARARRQ